MHLLVVIDDRFVATVGVPHAEAVAVLLSYGRVIDATSALAAFCPLPRDRTARHGCEHPLHPPHLPLHHLHLLHHSRRLRLARPRPPRFHPIHPVHRRRPRRPRPHPHRQRRKGRRHADGDVCPLVMLQVLLRLVEHEFYRRVSFRSSIPDPDIRRPRTSFQHPSRVRRA